MNSKVPKAQPGVTAAGTIVVDMGGTTTRVGVASNGRILDPPVRFATPRPTAGASVRDDHLDIVADEVRRQRLAHPHLRLGQIGVAIGATIDLAGRVRNASMLWHEANTGFDVAAGIRDRLDWADVVVRNDLEAAAWRYREIGRFAIMTVSTGVAVKVFDDRLPLESKVLLDSDALGGEIGHVRMDVSQSVGCRVAGTAGTQRRDNTSMDSGQAARATLQSASLPWCECGNIADLCSYTSGPATARLARMRAQANPKAWQGSALHEICNADSTRISTHDLVKAASRNDPFAIQVLHAATRPLASQILQISALLGLRRFVVTGGFARAAGDAWFSALRANIEDLVPSGGWFTGWTPTDFDALVVRSTDDDDSLVGMASLMAVKAARPRDLRKPTGEARVLIQHMPVPRHGREQFSVRIAYAGICGTDLQILRGERGCEPGVLGHECVGQVVTTGSDVSGVSIGDVISVNPNHPSDEHARLGHDQPGVFRDMATWDTHMAERGQIIRLPGEGRAEWVLLEPLACAVRSLRLAETWRDLRVLVVGAGVSGLLHVLVAQQWQASRVLLANRTPQRSAMAVARGVLPADDCVLLDANLPKKIDEETAGHGIDRVIVSVSAGMGPEIVQALWPCLANDATVHLFGGFPAASTLHTPNDGDIRCHEIRNLNTRRRVALPAGRTATVVGSRGASADDFQVARRLCISEGSDSPRLNLAPLISHVVSLESMPEVLSDLMLDGRIGGSSALRVLVDMSLTGRAIRETDGGDLPHIGKYDG